MTQAYPDTLEWPMFSVRVYAKRHAGTSSKCGQKQLVRIRSPVITPIGRLVRLQAVLPNSYGLKKTRALRIYNDSSRHTSPTVRQVFVGTAPQLSSAVPLEDRSTSLAGLDAVQLESGRDCAFDRPMIPASIMQSRILRAGLISRKRWTYGCRVIAHSLMGMVRHCTQASTYNFRRVKTP